MATGTGETLKLGYLFKESGKKWKKRYFVLTEYFLFCYKKEGATKAKGIVDLAGCLGVQFMEDCNVQWPGGVEASVCFGLATTAGNYYLYGSDEGDIREWMQLLGQVIQKNGNPTPDWQYDPVGKSGGAAAEIPGNPADAPTVVDESLCMATGAGLGPGIQSRPEGISKKKLAKAGAKVGLKAGVVVGRIALKTVAKVVLGRVPFLNTAMSIAGDVAETAVKEGYKAAKKSKKLS